MQQLRADIIAKATTFSLLLHGAILFSRAEHNEVRDLELTQPLALQLAITAPVQIPKPQPAPPKPITPLKQVAKLPKLKPAKIPLPKTPVAEVVAPVAQKIDTQQLAAAEQSAQALQAEISKKMEYEQQILLWLEKHKQYPLRARRRGVQGEGVVFISIDRAGRVLKSSLESSTGSKVLDNELLQMVRRSDPFPQPPLALSGGSFQFLVPVSFKLR